MTERCPWLTHLSSFAAASIRMKLLAWADGGDGVLRDVDVSLCEDLNTAMIWASTRMAPTYMPASLCRRPLRMKTILTAAIGARRSPAKVKKIAAVAAVAATQNIFRTIGAVHLVES